MPAARSRLVALTAVLLFAFVAPVSASSIPSVTVVDSIRPGADSSWAMDWSNSVAMGDWLYFNATDGIHGRELWRTDGDVTEMVFDINDGAGDGDPQGLYVVGNKLFFSANDGSNGIELWRTDGSPVGTSMVADIYVGGSSTPWPVGVLGDLYYFAANDGTTGVELWSINTNTLVLTLNEIAAGSGGSGPNPGINYLDYLYFVANDATNNRELWRTDGSFPEIVYASYGGNANPTDLIVNGGFLFFTEHLGEPGEYPGRTMYRTPGNHTVGTTLGGWDTNDADPQGTISLGGRLYFSATSSTYGRELWSSLGNSDHQLVANIRSGSGDSSPSDLTTFGSWLYFSADDGVHGRELYRSNGTATSLVADINSGGSSFPHYFTPLGDWLYFQAYEPVHGAALYRTNGTVTERVPLPTSDLTYTCDCFDTSIVSMGERLFFTVHGDAIGQEFAYLDEPTYSMPSTNRAPSTLTMALAQLAALTAAAALVLRRVTCASSVETRHQ